MFLHVPVCPQGGGTGVPVQVPPWAGTPPPGQVHPPGKVPPWQVHPPGAVHAGRYGQQAGGTHPTGMNSCFFSIYGI